MVGLQDLINPNRRQIHGGRRVKGGSAKGSRGRRGEMGSHRKWISVFVIFLLSFGFGELGSAFPNPRNGTIRVQSERGTALVLPLMGSEQQHGDHHISGRRRRGRGLGEDARMTLHDDLLTKGCEFSLSFSGF